MEKKIQLFLLPFAGGSSLSFMRLTRFLDPAIEAIALEYPGRGKRKEESFISDYRQFIEDNEAEIKRRRNIAVPFAILGYSMGSAIAYSIIRDSCFDQSAKHCFFCAEGGLIEPNRARKFGSLGDEDFLNEMLLLGGIDKRLLADRETLAEHLNIIKRDFDILAQYEYDGGTINQNITVIYSEKDNTCVNMGDWGKITKGNVEYATLGDSHFFLNQFYKEMAQIINKGLLRYIV